MTGGVGTASGSAQNEVVIEAEDEAVDVGGIGCIAKSAFASFCTFSLYHRTYAEFRREAAVFWYLCESASIRGCIKSQTTPKQFSNAGKMPFSP